MVAKINKHLGRGLYSVSEAALYARISSGLLSRWLFGTNKHRPTVDPEYGHHDRVVSFLDLIQSLAIRQIRLQKKVPLSKIREAIHVATRSGVEYPFARQHCTYLFDKELVIRHSQDDVQFIEASGRHKGQLLFKFVEPYLQELRYASDGLAIEYTIYESRDRVPIIMNPQRRFGEPILPSGYTALMIFDAIGSEGGIDNAAIAYGIPREEVEAAFELADHLNKPAA